MAVLSEQYIPERVMNSIDPAEVQARIIHEQKTAEALKANEIAKQESIKEIPEVEKRIKEGIGNLLGNQDGQKSIVLGVLEARQLLSHAIGSQAYAMRDGVEVLISRESPESRIVISPLNPQERKYTQILSVNGPMTASDLTLLAREEIKAERSGNSIDPMEEKLRILKGWDRIVSHLVQPPQAPTQTAKPLVPVA